MAVHEIPLLAQSQQFTTTLGGVTYNLRVYWCEPANCWMADIADQDNNSIKAGMPLVTGGDLLSQFAYLGIGGQLIVQSDDDTGAVPTFDSLGSTGHLYFVSPDV